MPRFFVQGPVGETAYVGGENGRHIVRSLRMKPGEPLTLCDGAGYDYHGSIESCDENGALVRVEEKVPCESEPALRVTVCQCLPKADKLELVAQKSVELGACELRLVTSARCIVKLDEKAARKKTERLQKIALEAAKQSGRGLIPEVFPPVTLETALREARERGESFLFYEGGGESLGRLLEQVGDALSIFVGPEGGFAPEEVELAKKLGAKPATLGKRILRTETAPLAALAAIMALRGELD